MDNTCFSNVFIVSYLNTIHNPNSNPQPIPLGPSAKTVWCNGRFTCYTYYLLRLFFVAKLKDNEKHGILFSIWQNSWSTKGKNSKLEVSLSSEWFCLIVPLKMTAKSMCIYGSPVLRQNPRRLSDGHFLLCCICVKRLLVLRNDNICFSSAVITGWLCI